MSEQKDQLNNLVYVHFNAKLFKKLKKKSDKNDDVIFDDSKTIQWKIGMSDV